MKPFSVETDDGAVLTGVIEGRGPTVVLAHGWTGTRAAWRLVAERLVAGGHTVVRYDQRGHGSSGTGIDPASIARLGADLSAVLASVDATDAVVAGHSMGGMTAIAFALDHPAVAAGRVKELVLVATAAAAPIPSRRRRAAALRLAANPRLERLLAGRAGPALMRPTLGRALPRTALLATRDEYVGTPAAVRREWMQAISAMDNLPRLAEVAVPTTVISAGRDRLTPPRCSAALAGGIPGARLVEVARAGHLLPLETPDLVATVIAEACRRLSAADPAVVAEEA